MDPRFGQQIGQALLVGGGAVMAKAGGVALLAALAPAAATVVGVGAAVAGIKYLVDKSNEKK